MSIYGGFPTRGLENAYNHCLFEIISLMQEFLITVLRSKLALDRSVFCDNFSKYFNKLVKFEKKKHLAPKFSDVLQEINNYTREVYNSSNFTQYTEKKHFVSGSTYSFGKDIELKRWEVSSPKKLNVIRSRNRQSSLRARESPAFNRNEYLRSYQDQVMKSIIKELSPDLDEN
ncbi:hypothetical protein SteCoe_30014 [Stentor coeruleus]|uniref:Uncharacterized protein n=1 Tax=Stentor coeruleus TaxID=5963 RepID=A0A1R2B4N7_9CILI|nr:hypothetical protein SteCoe_30014 [Stentor coeruleus]